MPLSEIRDNMNNLRATMATPTPAHLTERTLDIPTRGAHHLTLHTCAPASPPLNTALPVIVLFHGGGYMLGSPDMEAKAARLYASTYPILVACPSYRFAPEHPYPAPFEDTWDALAWLSSPTNAQTLNPAADPRAGLLVGGTSAGANLALACGLRAANPTVFSADARWPALKTHISGLHLVVPSTVHVDRIPERFAPSLLSRAQNHDADGLTAEEVTLITTSLSAPLTAPDAYPLSNLPDECLQRLPRTVVFAAGADLLRDDGLCLARTLPGDKGRAKVYKGCTHGSHYIAPGMKESQRFWRDAVAGVGWLLEEGV